MNRSKRSKVTEKHIYEPLMQSLKRQETVSHIIYRQIQTGYIKLVTHSPLFT